MNLRNQILTNNDCYQTGKRIKVKGLMLHSTGANNPKLSRYVQPDDGILGDNPNNNDWNQPGIEKCVHGFIGKGKDGKIYTYQTLPWDYRGWHAGGDANNTHIGVEICEDNLKDEEYFDNVYKEAVELFAYLCDKFNLTEKNIIDHSEGRKLGIASNHGDVMHWFPKHGKSMDTFRADVKRRLTIINKGATTPAKPAKPATPPANETAATIGKSIDQLAQEVIDGKWGSGAEREKLLGAKYEEVQARVNDMMNAPKTPKVAPKPAPVAKTIDQLAREVIDGKHGAGADRKKSLGNQYQAVQQRVNEILGTPKTNASKSVATLADEVMAGKHGSGRERMLSLGNKYAAVQAEVNRRMRRK